MQPDFSNLKKSILTSRTITIMLIVGIVLFNIVIIVIQKIPFYFEFTFNNPLVMTGCIIAVALYFTAIILKKHLFGRISKEGSISSRYYQYNKTLVTILAMYEFPALFASVVLLLTANTIMYIIIALSLIFMIFNFPMPDKLKEILHLSNEEYELFF